MSRRTIWSMLTLVVVLAMLLVACKPTPTPTPAKKQLEIFSWRGRRAAQTL